MTDEERLARAIARGRHGTDVMWPNFIGSAREAITEMALIRAETRSPEIGDMLANVGHLAERH